MLRYDTFTLIYKKKQTHTDNICFII